MSDEVADQSRISPVLGEATRAPEWQLLAASVTAAGSILLPTIKAMS